MAFKKELKTTIGRLGGELRTREQNLAKFVSDKTPKICDNMRYENGGSGVMIYNCAKVKSRGGGQIIGLALLGLLILR